MAQSPKSTICDLSVEPSRWPLTINSQHSNSLRWVNGLESPKSALFYADDPWNYIHNVVKTNHENMRLGKQEHIEREYSVVSTSSSSKTGFK